jgi:plasmid stabilization system protein ParE
MAQLRFTESAERDLMDIGNFIARDSPANAARFMARLEEHCELLAAPNCPAGATFSQAVCEKA